MTPDSPLTVDASAVAAVLFAEASGDRIAQRLEHRALLAPSLLPYELANVCARKQRGDPARVQALQACLEGFELLDVRLVEVPAAAACALAGTTGLSAYDAAYLWVSRTLAAPLVTLDRALAAAARVRAT